jgi:hypothetical protein
MSAFQAAVELCRQADAQQQAEAAREVLQKALQRALGSASAVVSMPSLARTDGEDAARKQALAAQRLQEEEAAKALAAQRLQEEEAQRAASVAAYVRSGKVLGCLLHRQQTTAVVALLTQRPRSRLLNMYQALPSSATWPPVAVRKVACGQGVGLCVSAKHEVVIVSVNSDQRLDVYSSRDGSFVRSVGSKGSGQCQFDFQVLHKAMLCVTSNVRMLYCFVCMCCSWAVSV